MNLAARYEAVRSKIRRAAGNEAAFSRITLIAVSKTRPVEEIEALYRLGHRDFGENYVQEMVAKAEALRARGCEEIRWHFIGHLQSNKVRTLVPWVHAVHTVDSEKLGLELARRWQVAGRSGRLPIFIEVNLDREESKSGVPEESVPPLCAALSEIYELSVQGLMCIPNVESTREGLAFRRLRALGERCRPYTAGYLSMGMSDDFEVAIREGATCVRVGTALFGPRPAV